MINKSILPKTWAITTFESLIFYAIGGDWGNNVDAENEKHSVVYCIRGSEFRNWDSDKGNTASLRSVKETSLLNRRLQENDILVEISGGGPEQPVGRTVLIDKECLSFHPETPKIPTNFLRLIRISTSISAKFLNFYLLYFYRSGKIVNYQAGSNNLRNLKFNDYIGIDIPIPSFKEQHRIVAKIEELFSELDKGIESLKIAHEQLKVYRQALLKHAFEGKLTEQWRKENVDKLETADRLLERIKLEREARYQQQLEEWKAAVKQWKKHGEKRNKPSKPVLIKELDQPNFYETKAFRSIPDSWVLAKIGDVALVGTGVTPLKSRSDYYENGTIAWVTSGALNKPFVLAASGYVTELAIKETSLRLYPEHTLVMAMYGEGKTRGKCSELLISATINQAIAAIVQCGTEENIRPYLKWFLIKNYNDIRRKSSGGVQPNLNLGIIENTVFPVCSLAEMTQIVAELERQFSVIDEIDVSIDEQLQKSEALRQSILKKAFSGQLVPQDPSDEPASALLERIAREKAKAGSPGKKSRTSQTEQNTQHLEENA